MQFIRKAGRASAAAALGILAVAAATSAAAAPPGWIATETKADGPVEGATQLLGDLTKIYRDPLHIVVTLKLRNEANLDAYLVRTHTLGDSMYGQTLTESEFVDQYGPTQQQVDAVASYLQKVGLKNINWSANRLQVYADALPWLMGIAFGYGTSSGIWKSSGHVVVTNNEDASVPASLSQVQSIIGLSTAHVANKMIMRPTAAAAAGSVGHVPTDFPSIYNALGVASASTVPVAVVASGNLLQVEADLRAYEAQNGLPVVPLTFLPQEIVGTDTSGLDEWDLDTQTITSMAGNVSHLYVYNAASLSDADLTTTYNQIVIDNFAKVISISLGECERGPHSDGSMAADDTIFKEAMAQGQTFFVSSGDGGANTGCGAQQGLTKQVAYPASSPYVVAVGGTTLSTTGTTVYGSETAWGKSGGGTSSFESPGAAQAAAKGVTKREVPDVAMDADPNSGAIIVYNGGSLQVGGTSLASPMAAGAWARVLGTHPTVGTAAPAFYTAASKSPAPFHDITSGTNCVGLVCLLNPNYKAGTGYDEVTGIGSLNVGLLNTAIK